MPKPASSTVPARTVSRGLAGGLIALVVVMAGGGSNTDGPGGEARSEGEARLTFRLVHGQRAPDAELRARVQGGGDSTEALLEKVLAGLGRASVIDRARIGVPPDEDYGPSEDFQIHGPNWIFFDVRCEFFGPTKMTADWQAALVAGAFRDLLARARLPGALGFSVIYHYPTGATQTHETVLAGPTANDVEAGSSAAIATRVRSALEASRSSTGTLTAVLTLVRPLEHGVSLVITAHEPARALAFLETNISVGKVEGWYGEVRDKDGRPVVAFYSSARTRTGGKWGPDERLLGRP